MYTPGPFDPGVYTPVFLELDGTPSNSKKTIKEQLDEYVGVQKVVITGISGGSKLADTNHLVGDLNIRLHRCSHVISVCLSAQTSLAY